MGWNNGEGETVDEEEKPTVDAVVERVEAFRDNGDGSQTPGTARRYADPDTGETLCVDDFRHLDGTPMECPDGETLMITMYPHQRR